jgi:hypothetical protein
VERGNGNGLSRRRTLGDIQREADDTATVRNVVAVLSAKLDLQSRYGMYEYEASAANDHESADIFRSMQADERRHIDLLLDLLRSQ